MANAEERRAVKAEALNTGRMTVQKAREAARKREEGVQADALAAEPPSKSPPRPSKSPAKPKKPVAKPKDKGKEASGDEGKAKKAKKSEPDPERARKGKAPMDTDEGSKGDNSDEVPSDDEEEANVGSIVTVLVNPSEEAVDLTQARIDELYSVGYVTLRVCR